MGVHVIFYLPNGLGKHGRKRANKDMVVRSFQKCGISTSIDGSEDDLIHIKGLEHYCIEDVVTDDSEDPFLRSDESLD